MTQKEFAAESWKNFTSLVNKSDNLAETVGRPSHTVGSGEHIWADIKNKLSLKEKGTLLDIGCGFGEVTEYLLRDVLDSDVSLTLLDAPGILDRINRSFFPLIKEGTRFVSGYFPENKETLGHDNKFDYILSYSVLHYADDPKGFIDSAVQLLAPGGKLLLGDFANVHKKGRFLSTSQGRKFEAEYKKIDISKVPFYKDQFHFFNESINNNKNINDELLFHIIKNYRQQGYDVFVLPQPEELTCSKTREDILIVSLF